MPRNSVPATAPGLPSAILHEIHDSLVLALDASERPRYSQPEREARSYLRHALRDTRRLLGEARA
ncbi:hypothetical protein Q9295_01710 [Xinfangfangia sp. CPCC 101601]|uniref:Uncharacterized protein n=1 Tax=Pseudogemmobacter lacusdianii TaxID=3069608 RepID=A0ABU0VTL7_9RHOB|nr:hypothetical protein [Xinfangfangia sp. CPCC 101601]MDQ2065074.1 hypothetical protein [Xinfangfangia sp. CPCC 101601]